MTLGRVLIRDGNYVRQGALRDFGKITAIPRFNQVGSWAIERVPVDEPRVPLLLANQAGVILTREDGTSIMSGPVRRHETFTDSDGIDYLNFYGPDDNIVLKQVAYPAPNRDVQTGWWGYASDLKPVSWYKLDEMQGTVMKDERNKNPGTYLAGVQQRQGGSVLYPGQSTPLFTGATGYATHGQRDCSFQTRCVAIWFATTWNWNDNTIRPIWQSWNTPDANLPNGMSIFKYSSNALYVRVISENWTMTDAIWGSAGTLTNAVWHLLVAGYDAVTGKIKLWVDGLPRATSDLFSINVPTALQATGAPDSLANLGRSGGGTDASAYFEEVLLANQLPSDDLVAKMYSAGLNPPPPYDVRTGAGETVMRAYLTANLISPTGDTSRAQTHLVQGAAGTLGDQVYGAARFQSLLELFQDLAIQAGGLRFNVIQDSTSTDRTLKISMPTDRSSTVVFSRDFHNLRSYRYTAEAPEGNALIVGGSGEGLERSVRTISDPTSISKWGRIERFYDQRNIEGADEMQAAAESGLQEFAEKLGLSIEPADITRPAFMIEYDVGDKVTVVVRGVQIVQPMTEVRLELDKDGESIQPSVGELDQNVIDRFFSQIDQSRERLTELERI